MKNISQKYCETLELPKILQELANLACCDHAREKILAIRPETNYRLVLDELQKTNDAFELSALYGSPHFSNMTDPTPSLQMAEKGGMLSTHALLNIAAVLREIRSLVEWYGRCKGKETSLSPIFGQLRPNKTLEQRITSVIITEEEIDDYASDELAVIRKRIRHCSLKIRESLNRVLRSESGQRALQENLVTMRDGRYVVPVKAEYRGEVKGLVHDTSSTGATLFIEPMAVVEANNELKVLKAQEKAEIERILYELSALCAADAQMIFDNFETVIDLHIYFVKAHYAENTHSMMPKVVNDGTIRLHKARHPLIDKNQVVPIDVEVGGKFRILCVTGPNTGGKTVTLKTIGLLTLMTMCGMMIPVASDSVISVFDKVLVDIGDEQSIEQSLSTFSSHITNTIRILQKADAHSLVLLDELGSGTDPTEGAALAIAILQKLRKLHSVVGITTHYAELKVFALQTEGVENACCEFDVQSLRPTYRLLIGVPGRSNAFAISARLGLQEEILNDAKALVAGDQRKFEDVIEQLETSREEYERKKAECDRKQAELEELQKRLHEDMGDTLQKRDDIIDRANREAQRLVAQVEAQSKAIIEELDKLRREKDKADFSERELRARNELRSKLGKMYEDANPVATRDNSEYVLPRPLKVGDTVLMVDINQRGTVTEVGSKKVVVATGAIKTKVDISNLRLVQADPKQQKNVGGVKKTLESNRTRSASLELDLRGQTVDEAIMSLDMYLNKALMMKTNQFTVIHGKGTGALRAAVHQFLKHNKFVKTYRLGVYGEGENGVTIVELK